MSGYLLELSDGTASAEMLTHRGKAGHHYITNDTPNNIHQALSKTAHILFPGEALAMAPCSPLL